MKFSVIGKVGLLALTGILVFVMANRLVGVSADAIIGLVGAIVGAVIAAFVQFITHRTEQFDRYRLAAIVRRLQAHQEAFALWQKLISYVHDKDQIGSVVIECQSWWNNNCLYLDEKARNAFRYAYRCAHNHKNFLQDRSNRQLIEKNWADIIAAGDALADAVALPPIGDLVSEYADKALGKKG